MADRTISGNYMLMADEDWSDGKLLIAPNARINMNGHNLTIGKIEPSLCITNADGIVAGYADLEYLDTDGTQYAVLTESYLPDENDRVEVCVRFNGGAGFIYGSRIAALNRAFNLYFDGSKARMDYSNKQYTSKALTVDDDYVLTTDGSDRTFEITTGNTSVYSASMANASTFTPVAPSYLLGLNNNGSVGTTAKAKVRFYYFKVYGGDGTLKSHIVPVYDKANGRIGLYDRVVGKFFANSGTGSFISETDEIREITNTYTTDEYSALDYLVTSGSQYVLTEFKPECTDKVETKVSFTTVGTSTQFLWCDRTASGGSDRFSGGIVGGKYRFDRRNANYDSNTLPDANTITTVVADYGTGSCLVDDTSVAMMSNYESLYETATNILLFAAFELKEGKIASLGSYAKIRFYYFKIYGRDKTLKCDIVPAKRESDGVIGLYDRVAKKFYLNNGTGSFSPGDVSTPMTYQGDIRELHVKINENETFANSLAISGDVKLVKEGLGTLVAARTGQTYRGGTVVTSGILQYGGSSRMCGLGAYGSTITVSTNGDLTGILDMNGHINQYDGYKFVMDGGVIENRGSSVDTYLQALLSNVRLTNDSTFRTPLKVAGYAHGFMERNYSVGSGSASAYPVVPLDLDGHTLLVEAGAITYMNHVVATAGTIMLTGIGAMEFCKNGSDLRLVDLTVDGSAQLRSAVIAGKVELGNYTVNTTNPDGAATTNVLVYGTFKPNTDYFVGCEIQDGVTIDMTGRSTALKLKGLSNPGKPAIVNTITFADEATVNVKLGMNRPENPIITWEDASDKPENWDSLTFKLAEDSAVKLRLFKGTDGVYARSGLVILIR